ncbi:helix-turn-helix transcriptional regulator [Actibacterium ureilyticum]|uniref:helix-turn-helix transcriptional regulator n=1 Tax=Actibacterium ureilyticum TaxID=1590614 RepID=UPI000BAAC33A|nr:helix-turn-helix transcriptional regulator [Actibacterium ureilyticum]
MPRNTLTGTRIRERRLVLGLRQSDVARGVGISPSYLNLIEHNRRRIGGKLLLDLARRLSVEPSALTEGAEAAQLEALREAAVAHNGAKEEMTRIEEFVGRFPGWAALLSDQSRRIADLERTVELLTDRMAHDPHLAASLHEVLSTVTAIRSTAAILADTDDIDPEWQERFHRNIFDESQRLAHGAQALVNYLDETTGDAEMISSPQEEVEAFLRKTGHHVAPLERARAPRVQQLVKDATELTSVPARELARSYLKRYRQDALRMPAAEFLDAAARCGWNPAVLAAEFDAELAAVFRRLATLPKEDVGFSIGLVVCDGSGTLTFRKPVEGFSLPRFGAACPLWPLYQALSRPSVPIRSVVETAGRTPHRFLTYAICQPLPQSDFTRPPVLEASMMILADPGLSLREQAMPVGTSCRICPLGDCIARREPSILSDGF